MEPDSEEVDRWAVPPGLTPEQQIDWEQARTLDSMARSVRKVSRRLEALEKLVDTVVRPVLEASAAWTKGKHTIADALWNSGIGSFKTGPALVTLFVIVILSAMAQQCGVDINDLSKEGRMWWNGECSDGPLPIGDNLH